MRPEGFLGRLQYLRPIVVALPGRADVELSQEKSEDGLDADASGWKVQAGKPTLRDMQMSPGVPTLAESDANARRSVRNEHYRRRGSDTPRF